MFGGPFDHALLTAVEHGAQVLAALLFCGLAVRLMDDALDAPYDRLAGRRTLGTQLGSAGLAYALAALAIAFAVERHVAAAAFACAYALGMGTSLGRRMPSGLPGWSESLLALGFAVWIAGVHTTAALFLALVAAQACDDMIDAHTERPIAGDNWANHLGLGGTGLLGLGALAAAAALEPLLTAALLSAIPIVEALSAQWVRQLTHKRTGAVRAAGEVAP